MSWLGSETLLLLYIFREIDSISPLHSKRGETFRSACSKSARACNQFVAWNSCKLLIGTTSISAKRVEVLVALYGSHLVGSCHTESKVRQASTSSCFSGQN